MPILGLNHIHDMCLGPVYNLSNYQDPVTFRTEHEIVAVALCLELGQGERSVTWIGGQTVCPQLTAPGYKDDPEAYFKRRYGKDLKDIVKTHEFVQALDSMLYCTDTERILFEVALRHIETNEHKQDYFDRINSMKRTTLEDIVGVGQNLSGDLKSLSYLGHVEPTPKGNMAS